MGFNIDYIEIKGNWENSFNEIVEKIQHTIALVS